jgi:hypothetical protein
MNAQNRSWRCRSLVMLVLAFSGSTASAQNTSLASLQGKVTDESAAPMPGVVSPRVARVGTTFSFQEGVPASAGPCLRHYDRPRTRRQTA